MFAGGERQLGESWGRAEGIHMYVHSSSNIGEVGS